MQSAIPCHGVWFRNSTSLCPRPSPHPAVTSEALVKSTLPELGQELICPRAEAGNQVCRLLARDPDTKPRLRKDKSSCTKHIKLRACPTLWVSCFLRSDFLVWLQRSDKILIIGLPGWLSQTLSVCLWLRS